MTTLTRWEKRVIAQHCLRHYVAVSRYSKLSDRLLEHGIIDGIGLVQGRREYWRFTAYGRHLAFQAHFELEQEAAQP